MKKLGKSPNYNGQEGEELRPLIEQVKQNLPEYGGNIMSYAEELRQEGLKQGMSYAEQLRREGIQQGLQEGQHEAQLEIARELLKRGMDKEEISAITHLTPSQMSELKKANIL
ncbi:MAG: hypothetical protein K0R14_1508 [Burkholderiales bacterium]|nr:hypothetical protein [Burkholderiales bacterium]